MKMKCKHYITQFGRILIQGLKGFQRNKMMIFASLLVTTVMMLVLGVCYIVSRNVNYMIDSYINKEHILSVYLHESISDKDAEAFSKILEKDERIKTYIFISKEQAFDDFKNNFPKESFDYVFSDKQKDFLPVSYNITLYDNNLAQDVINELQILNFRDLGIEPGEELVPENEVVWQYSSTQKMLDTAESVRNIVNIVGVAATSVLMFFAIIIISNTIMLSVLSRKKEIQIMNHIGATKRYIEGPFIVEGCAIGLFGAIIALLLLRVIYGFAVKLFENSYTVSQVFDLELIAFPELSTLLIVGLFLVGMIIGSTGAKLTAGKYIKN